MADLQRLENALRQADAAGNTEDARRLAAAIQRQRSAMTHQPVERRPQQTVPTGEGMLRNGLQSLTFGFGDEIVAGAAAAVHPLVNPDDGSSFGERYDFYRDRERGEIGSFRESNPAEAGVAEIGGAVGPAALIPGFAGTGGFLSTASRGGAVGGTEAFAYGFGAGEGGFGERVQEGIETAPVGVVAGAAAPFAGEGVRRVASALAAPVTRNTTKADRFMGKTLRRSGRTVEELEQEIASAAADGQTGFVLADAMGRRGQRALSSVTRQPSDIQNEIVDFLDNRQAGQSERLSSFLADGFGANDTAAQRVEKLRQARKDAAEIEYAAARDNAGPVNLNGAIRVIDQALRRDPILGETALSNGEMGRRLKALGDQLSSGDEQLVDFENVLRIKSDLFETLRRNPNAGPELREVYGQLDAALEAASPAYRQANDNYRAASQAIDAVEVGQVAARPRTRPGDVADTFASMSPAEREAFRGGFGDTLIGRVEASATGADSSRPLTTPKLQSDIDTLASDPDRLRRQIDREQTMFETRRQATGGSQTADNLADEADVNGANTVGLVADAATTGGAVTVARNIARSLGNMATGTNDETVRMIARALLSRDPASALSGAIGQSMADRRTAQLVEALLRSGSIRAEATIQ